MLYSRLTVSRNAAQDYLELECSLCLFFGLSFTPGPLALGGLQSKLLHCVVHCLPAVGTRTSLCHILKISLENAI